MAERRQAIDESSMPSCPGKQKACMRGWEDPDGSSFDISAGMVRTWKGPAAKAMCWTEVRMAWE